MAEVIDHPKKSAKKQSFPHDFTALPVTMQQFEDLTNEILIAINNFCAPHFLGAEYMAQVLMSAIHAMDHKHGYAYKSDLFESCMNRISCHITYHAVQEIQAKLKAEEAAKNPEALATPTVSTSEMPIEQETGLH